MNMIAIIMMMKNTNNTLYILITDGECGYIYELLFIDSGAVVDPDDATGSDTTMG